MTTRLFSEAEIAEMEKRTVDRLTEAIEAGDTDRAKRIAQRWSKYRLRPRRIPRCRARRFNGI